MTYGHNFPAKRPSVRPSLPVVQLRVAAFPKPVAGTPLPNDATIEQTYRLFDPLLEGCQLLSFDWRYLYLNEAAARQGRRAKTELLGYTLQEQYPGIEQTALFTVLQRAMHERTVEHLENEFIYADGTSARFELKIQPAPEGILILSLDITEREAADRAAHEQRLEAILNNSTDGILLVDDNLCIQQTNASFDQLFACATNAYVGQSLTALVAAEAVNTVILFVATTLTTTKGKQLELRAQRADGAVFDAELSVGALHGAGIVCTVRDITERKAKEAALRESEARYRLLTENNTDVIIRFNTASEFSYVSPSSTLILGYTPAELLGQSALSHVHPSDQHVVVEAMQRAFQPDPQQRSLVIRFQHRQGHYLWLEISGQVIYAEKTGALEGIVIAARDISARKAAELALQASEEKYRLLIENMRGLLVVYDTEARLTYVNDRIDALLGYTRAEVLGRSAYDHSDAAMVALLQTQFALRRQLISSAYELTLSHKNGRPVHLLVSASPILNKEGAYDGSLAVMTDITVQKHAEAALRQALAKEKELSELKSRFVSMASHEFRTPLATILILVETLSAYRHKFTEEQIELRFTRIKEQINHLKGIMEDVLLLSRMQARRVDFNPVTLDLDLFCRAILDEFHIPSDDQARLQYQSSGVPRPVQADPKLLRQILSNLVSNALKYSPDAIPIQVSLAFTEESFILQVCDKGIGIPEADLNHLFEPFHRAANVGAISGTGLGMVITKEAVELHGGTITVDSQVKQGTTCSVRIPFVITAPAQDDTR